MTALLAGFLTASILCGVAVPDASAARKRSPGDGQRPHQDSVLSIPRVGTPPDLAEFLRRADHGKRVAKIEGEPDRSKPGSSQPDTTREEKPALSRPADLEPNEEKLANPTQDSLLNAPQNPVPQGSLRTDSSSTGAQADMVSPETSLHADQVDSIVPGDLRPSIIEPEPSRSTDRVAGHDRAGQSTPHRARKDRTRSRRSEPGPPAIAPPDPPPSTPSQGPRGPTNEGLPVWVFVAGAVVLTAWVGIQLRRARARGRARHASGELAGGAPEGSNGSGAAGAVTGVLARDSGRQPPGSRPVAPAATMARARGHARVRRMFLANLLRVKGSLALAALFMVGGAAVELLKPWPLKIMLDHAILAKPLSGALSFLQGIASNRLNLLVAASAAIVLISVVGGLFSYLQVFITKGIGYRMVYALRREVFSHLQQLSLSFHNRARSGDLLTTFGKDTSTLKDVFAEALLKFADHSLSMIGMLTIMWFVNWKTCLLAVATLPFLFFTLMHLYRQTKVSLKKQRKQEGRVVSRMNEVLSAVPLVQAFGREQYEEDRYEAASNETLRESIRMTRLEAAATRTSYITSAIGTALVACVGGMEVLQGRMLPGDLVLVMSYVTSMHKPIRNLAKLSIECSKAAASAERIAEVLEVEPEIQDLPDAIEADAIRGAIHFGAVSFDYGDGKEVLRQVSFDVAPGQRVALVGVSGAGKSTIASLILRLYEAQGGVILIDGVDIARYRRESLRRQIGIVLQESLLFGATIRENIAYGKPEASPEEIVAAARTANADEFIRELEGGYDSVVGERGVTLSAGQRQRVAIARAVIRNPRILILDEPMRGLDAESETKVREALDRLMVHRTSILITHDLQSIADADQVLVLDDGAIVERGTYDELLSRRGRYRELIDLGPASAAAQSVGS